jgi:hypothetical protein
MFEKHLQSSTHNICHSKKLKVGSVIENHENESGNELGAYIIKNLS